MYEATSSERIVAQLVSGNTLPAQIQEAQWPGIIDTALRHNLGPMLFHNIGKKAALPGDFEHLRQSARQAVMTFLAQDSARWTINEAFQSANISCIWVKGSALAHTVYPAPELRPMGDLDVLVPGDDFEQAQHVLEDLGYRQSDHAKLIFPPAFAAKDDHHTVLKGGAGGDIVVELHWRLLTEMQLASDQGAWFWKQRQQVQIQGHTLTTLQPEAHLLYLCAHALLQHGEAQSLLMHYLDLHLIISHSPINWTRLIEQAVVFRWTYAVERALTTLTNLFGTQVPPNMLEALRQKRPAAEVTSQVEVLAGAGSHFEKVMRLMAGESLRSKSRLAAAILFPERSYIRARYSVPPGQALWPWYLRRWAHQGLEAWRAIRSRRR